jgi:hypothetical protein
MGKPFALAGSDFIQRMPTGLSRKSPAGNDKVVCCDRQLAAVPLTIAIESGTELAGIRSSAPREGKRGQPRFNMRERSCIQ